MSTKMQTLSRFATFVLLTFRRAHGRQDFEQAMALHANLD
jgi:hypothetical protein